MGEDSKQLLGEESEADARTVFWRYKGSKSVRKDAWKFLKEGDRTYLYNIEVDPGEKYNLINSERSIADSLILDLDRWEEDIDNFIINTK